jgi:hypothetical protein
MVMDIKRATEIQRHAVDAANAIDKAAEAIMALPKEDRARFAVHLEEISSALHFGLLPEIHNRFPELRPREERPAVSSFLLWEDVSLPDFVSEPELDALILSLLEPNWRKTAVIVGKAFELSKANGWPLDFKTFGARIQYLADRGQLDSQGDLSKWRHSEVRLKKD